MKLIRPLFIAPFLGFLLMQTERMPNGIKRKWPEKRQSEMTQAHMLKRIMHKANLLDEENTVCREITVYLNGGLCDGRFPMK